MIIEGYNKLSYELYWDRNCRNSDLRLKEFNNYRSPNEYNEIERLLGIFEAN